VYVTFYLNRKRVLSKGGEERKLSLSRENVEKEESLAFTFHSSR